MASPFPGMDPYLEDPRIWSGFHHTFLSAMQERLAPAVRPRYFVRVEERVWVTSQEDPSYRIVVPDMRVIAAGGHRRRSPRSAESGATSVIAEPIPVVEPDE